MEGNSRIGTQQTKETNFQIYVCNECDDQSQNLADLKKHNEKQHAGKNINETRVKQNREIQNEMDANNFTSHELFKDH